MHGRISIGLRIGHFWFIWDWNGPYISIPGVGAAAYTSGFGLVTDGWEAVRRERQPRKLSWLEEDTDEAT